MRLEDEVIRILRLVLNLNGSNLDFNSSTQLLGGIPEFDSSAVVAVLTAFEEAFDIEFEDEEISGEIFETIGSLTLFVDKKITENYAAR